jgi:carboxylesterase
VRVDLSNDPDAQSFRFDGGPKGCLLLHGLTGTPFEVRPIGERLAGLGYAVLGPCLPGHGTVVEDLVHTRWEDWFAATENAWDDLGRMCSARAVAGLSMGALLALHLAHERAVEVRAIAALAPALELRNQREAEHSLWLSRIPWLPRRLAIMPKRNDGRRNAGRQSPAYDEIPVRALASMILLQRRVRDELGQIGAPALVLEGGQDLTIAPGAAAAVEAALGSLIKRRITFPTSEHILTEGDEAPAVTAAVVRFFEEAFSETPSS